MSKHLILGNGNLLVGLDKYAFVRDLYFPFVGLENHIGGRHMHRVGVWVDGTLEWLNHPHWNVRVGSEREALSGSTSAVNDAMGVDVVMTDTVYNEKNIFLRKVTVTNKRDVRREIKVYFGQEFEIYQSHQGDTGFFDPLHHAIVHYNGRRVFLANGSIDGQSFTDYTTGIFEIEGKEGSYRDAEDGMLSQNPIEYGRTDSVIGFYASWGPGESKDVYYWMTVADTIKGATELHYYVVEKSPEHLMRTTHDFWRAWVNKYKFNFRGLSEAEVSLFKKSLLIVRAHADNRGGIIASADSDMLQNGRDTYGYVWPRDAVFAVMALDGAGDTNVAKRFFEFCDATLSSDGYFMHKYRPDRSLGSSWHPWVKNGTMELPIQEDETALVLYALRHYYDISKDIEFIESVYTTLIKKSADFMVRYRDARTGLPKSSYDLWEEKFGTSTFTSATVYGGLSAAAYFADVLGKKDDYKKYSSAAEEVKNGIMAYLYDKGSGNFHKMIVTKDNTTVFDSVIDASSVYGVFKFKILAPDDARLVRAVENMKEKLSRSGTGGITRYENDRYYNDNPAGSPGNPWFVTTLWLAQYYVARAKKESDFDEVKKWLAWTAKNALHSGVLSEQLRAETGEQLSATPLAWSHAEYIITIINYLDKMEELGICDKCNPVID